LKNLEQNGLSNAWSARRIIAGLLLVQFLCLLALTQSESLHKALHPDAGTAHHHCAVTLLQSGQVETPVFVAVAVPTVAAPAILTAVESCFVPSVDDFLPPSCGPPALLS
jgi:hypothetical protein